MVVYGICMYLYLFPKLSSDFKIPIAVYVVLLITMVIVSLFRDNKTGEKSFYFVFIGAILFAISDSILSLTLFDGRKGIYMRLACITPYFFGQWMIYWGCLHHKELEIRKLKWTKLSFVFCIGKACKMKNKIKILFVNTRGILCNLKSILFWFIALLFYISKLNLIKN